MPEPSQPSQPNLSRLLRRALRAHERGELPKAERLYNAALRYHPENFDALHGLGTAALSARTPRHGAGAHAGGAAKRCRSAPTDLPALGSFFMFWADFKEALASYDEGLSLDPGNAELLNRRGVALLELRRPREALEDFERVLAGDPDHLDALGNYGNALIKLNRPRRSAGRLRPGADDRARKCPAPDQPRGGVAPARSPARSVDEREPRAGREPDFAQARFVESVARLTLGDFAAGWRGYEARWAVGLLASQRRSFTAPLWLGQGIARRQNHFAARRAGFWRHHSVRALCAACGATRRRQNHSRSPA